MEYILGHVFDAFTYALFERIGCDYNSHRQCRTDQRICELGSAIDGYAKRATSQFTWLATIDCTRTPEDLSRTSGECTISGAGMCSDHDLHSFGWDSQAERHSPGCLLPFSRNPWGDPTCDHANGFHHTRTGCAASTVTTQAQ